jgi:sirohydrochlorin cobaltochelatase
MKYDHVILLAHGSPDSIWKMPFEALQAKVEKEYGKGKTSLAFMELTEPTLEQVVFNLDIEHKNIAVLPIFLAVGRHLRLDVPKKIQSLVTDDLKIELLKPIGDSPLLQNAMLEIIANQLEAS